MDLGSSITTTVVVMALVVAVAALVIAAGVHRRLAADRARYRILWTGSEKDLIAVLSHQSGQIAELHRELEKIRAEVSRTAGDVEHSLRHVAIVRYDASSGGVGGAGALSFSAAIINDRGEGLVVSSIQGGSESRSYATDVVRGASHASLTIEEQQALAAARNGKGTQS